MVARRVLWLLMLLSIQRGTWAFFTFTANSTNHLQMTEAAILQATADACRSFTSKMGTEFTLQGPLTVESLVKACSSSESAIGFRVAISEITKADVLVDVHGFNNDTFQRGRKLIINAIADVKADVGKHNFEAARTELGAALNTLQDFYTHGCLADPTTTEPYSKFIESNGSLLQNCGSYSNDSHESDGSGDSHDSDESGDSHDSHDPRDPHNGNLSPETEALAINVSVAFLQDIRRKVGDEDFLRLMKMNQSTSALGDDIDTVTLLQAVRDPGMSSRFDFFVDSSLRNLTIYITGQNPVFTVTSATDVSQMHNEATGALGTIKRVGNFFTVSVTTPLQKGKWSINISSIEHYTVKVVGQSPIAFLFNFVQTLEDPHPGFEFIQSRPLTNSTASLLVYVTEADSVQLNEVALVKESGETVVARNLTEKLRGIYLATVAMVPEGSFAVQVRGNGTFMGHNSDFQRQFPTQFKSSRVNINAQTPGDSPVIHFSVSSSISGNFTIRARNNRGFSMSFNTTLTLEAGGRANGTVTLTAPQNTTECTVVTLTIEAEAPGATDFNYYVLRLIVLCRN